MWANRRTADMETRGLLSSKETLDAAFSLHFHWSGLTASISFSLYENVPTEWKMNVFLMTSLEVLLYPSKNCVFDSNLDHILLILPFALWVRNWGLGQIQPLSCSHIGNPSDVKILVKEKDQIVEKRKSWSKKEIKLWEKSTFLVAQVLVLLQPSVGFLKSRQRRFLLRIKNFQSVLSDAETPFCQYKEDIGALYTLPPACGQLLSI